MSGARARERREPRQAPWLLMGSAAVIVLGGTFGVGVYVGRHWQRPAAQEAARPVETEAARKAPTPRRSGLVEPVAERGRESGEKLTFYQTLTAPLAPMPSPTRTSLAGSKPSADDRAKPAPPAAQRPAPEPRAAAVPDALTTQGARGEWVVQVGVFKDRHQADGLRKQLADAGVDPHIVDVPGEDGRPRHKVRVGTFRTRADAARVAERVAAERRLPTYVTSR